MAKDREMRIEDSGRKLRHSLVDIDRLRPQATNESDGKPANKDGEDHNPPPSDTEGSDDSSEG
ncbi:MAG: hypothetical protein J7M40_01050 [Planctomycetes bacterium]|nr:hypothetical protein [Planctomycetota bacterium]